MAEKRLTFLYSLSHEVDQPLPPSALVQGTLSNSAFYPLPQFEYLEAKVFVRAVCPRAHFRAPQSSSGALPSVAAEGSRALGMAHGKDVLAVVTSR